MELNIDIALGDYVESITRGFKGFVEKINCLEGSFSVIVTDVKGNSYATVPGDLTLIASYIPESSPYWAKAKTVDGIPSADDPRRVEASPKVDLKGFIEVTGKKEGKRFTINLHQFVLVEGLEDGGTRLNLKRTEYVEVRESYEEVLKLMEEALK